MFFPDVDARSRPDCAFRVVFTADRLVLPVCFPDILLPQTEYKAFASVSVKPADLLDAIPADEQVHKKAENGKADDIDELLSQVIEHG